jgi:hypothetical protein
VKSWLVVTIPIIGIQNPLTRNDASQEDNNYTLYQLRILQISTRYVSQSCHKPRAGF